jgi:hypothetical protein
MEFFFPDSQDQINLQYDFLTEDYPIHRVRQRDDLYAHEALKVVPYDGILISKAIVDGGTYGGAKYTIAQKQRIYRLGAHQFFRANDEKKPLYIMGDCGAFTYADEEHPPYTVEEVIDFYEGLGLDRGVSMDHIVFGYLNEKNRNAGAEVDPEWIRRRELTIELAAEFLRRVKKRKCGFEPVGVAHGWDPKSYQKSVRELQRIGFTRISIGGMVPLKTNDIREVVQAIASVRKDTTQFHLLGITRTDFAKEFTSSGVTSLDSTSPFRQSFMDATDNFHTAERTFIALRVPQVDGNATMKRQIRAGLLDQRLALKAERHCLETLRAFDAGSASVEDAVSALREYEILYDSKKDRSDLYRQTLEAAPWKSCGCGICGAVGVEVIMFRGSERNKRRGFHNLAVFHQTLNKQRRIPKARTLKKANR